ncbi:uncharacterized protein LOC124683518 isoform X2 [Lolium rigidum]|uniref:uncharacterized protein LOC124683518 isoform X2 n=1 Tax=Lolium rigidum TaxID=89674 RepID=UPI001F5DA714|nr:uncharacterized protein LOC124683518 isoform X2 [Lolium rigidum]
MFCGGIVSRWIRLAAEAAMVSLQDDDSVSSNAGPAAAGGVSVLGNVENGSAFYDGAAWLAWRSRCPLIPPDQLGTPIHNRPDRRRDSVSAVHHLIELIAKNVRVHWRSRSGVSVLLSETGRQGNRYSSISPYLIREECEHLIR